MAGCNPWTYEWKAATYVTDQAVMIAKNGKK